MNVMKQKELERVELRQRELSKEAAKAEKAAGAAAEQQDLVSVN